MTKRNRKQKRTRKARSNRGKYGRAAIFVSALALFLVFAAQARADATPEAYANKVAEAAARKAAEVAEEDAKTESFAATLPPRLGQLYREMKLSVNKDKNAFSPHADRESFSAIKQDISQERYDELLRRLRAPKDPSSSRKYYEWHTVFFHRLEDPAAEAKLLEMARAEKTSLQGLQKFVAAERVKEYSAAAESSGDPRRKNRAAMMRDVFQRLEKNPGAYETHHSSPLEIFSSLKNFAQESRGQIGLSDAQLKLYRALAEEPNFGKSKWILTHASWASKAAELSDAQVDRLVELRKGRTAANEQRYDAEMEAILRTKPALELPIDVLRLVVENPRQEQSRGEKTPRTHSLIWDAASRFNAMNATDKNRRRVFDAVQKNASTPSHVRATIAAQIYGRPQDLDEKIADMLVDLAAGAGSFERPRKERDYEPTPLTAADVFQAALNGPERGEKWEVSDERKQVLKRLVAPEFAGLKLEINTFRELMVKRDKDISRDNFALLFEGLQAIQAIQFPPRDKDRHYQPAEMKRDMANAWIEAMRGTKESDQAFLLGTILPALRNSQISAYKRYSLILQVLRPGGRYSSSTLELTDSLKEVVKMAIAGAARPSDDFWIDEDGYGTIPGLQRWQKHLSSRHLEFLRFAEKLYGERKATNQLDTELSIRWTLERVLSTPNLSAEQSALLKALYSVDPRTSMSNGLAENEAFGAVLKARAISPAQMRVLLAIIKNTELYGVPFKHTDTFLAVLKSPGGQHLDMAQAAALETLLNRTHRNCLLQKGADKQALFDAILSGNRAAIAEFTAVLDPNKAMQQCGPLAKAMKSDAGEFHEGAVIAKNRDFGITYMTTPRDPAQEPTYGAQPAQ